MTIAEILATLETPRRAHWHAAGATEEEISRCEERIGLPLPDAYKDLLRISNGIILYETEELLATDYFWEFGESISEATDRLRKEEEPRLPPTLIPFAYNPGGIYWCFDAGDPQLGTDRVVKWTVGKGIGVETYASLGDWLLMLRRTYHHRYR